MIEIIIHEEKCTGCGNCVIVCPVGSKNPETAAGKPQYENAVISIVDGCCRVLDRNICLGCKMCMKSCPSGAIEVIKQ